LLITVTSFTDLWIVLFMKKENEFFFFLCIHSNQNQASTNPLPSNINSSRIVESNEATIFKRT